MTDQTQIIELSCVPNRPDFVLGEVKPNVLVTVGLDSTQDHGLIDAYTARKVVRFQGEGAASFFYVKAREHVVGSITVDYTLEPTPAP